MKKLIFSVISLTIFFVASCIPPKKEVPLKYDFKDNFKYLYSFEIKGSGNFSYLLLDYSGDFEVKGDLNILTYLDENNEKSYLVYIENVKVSIPDIDNFINKEASKFKINFKMTDKGEKIYQVYNPFIQILLDIVIPVLPSYTDGDYYSRTFSSKIENLDVKTEVKRENTIKVILDDGFVVNSTYSISILELENVDIVVSKVDSKLETKVLDGIIDESIVEFYSKSTIPLRQGYFTTIIGFKGKGVILVKRKNYS